MLRRCRRPEQHRITTQIARQVRARKVPSPAGNVQFASATSPEDDEAHWPLATALATLAVVTVLVALVSEVFVESVQEAAAAFGMTAALVGFVVLRIERARNVRSAQAVCAERDERPTALPSRSRLECDPRPCHAGLCEE